MGIFSLVGDVLGMRAGTRTSRRNIRYDREQATTAYGRFKESSALDYERSKEFAQNQAQWRTDDAEAAGVHPLFAMGAGTTSFQPGGGSMISGGGVETGSGAGNAIRSIGKNLDKMREDWLAAQINNTKAKTAQILSNANQDQVVRPGFVPEVQEIDKGRVQPHYKKNPEQNLSVLSPMTKFRMGSQTVFLPIEEMDQMMEDPAAVALAAYNYHGNKNVNWRKLGEEYTGSKMGSSLANRNQKAFKAGAKVAKYLNKLSKKSRRQKVQRTFFRKKPRQTRGY